MFVENFWKPFEEEVTSFRGLVEIIERMMERAVFHGIQFAWRGQVDASWALHSSLYRRLCLTNSITADEDDLLAQETRILTELHRWGLHSPPLHGRLSVLHQLAMLQHYGSPTRLIDITFNAWVAAWFAVEQKWCNAEAVHEDKDARLFAIDVTDRLINEKQTYRGWEDHFSRPWKPEKFDKKEWTTSVFAWKPPAIDARIFAQNGGFLLGGVPASVRPNGNRFQFPKSPRNNDGHWKIEDARRACCLAVRPHKFEPVNGGVGTGALYTFRISAKAKASIRDRLEKIFGYKHSTIYPDYTGFSSFGTPHLKTF
jgi:hypothetical protein